MSIYATMWDTDSADHTAGEEGLPFCSKWVQVPEGTPEFETARMIMGAGPRYNLDDTKPCTCGAGVLPYNGSHIMPGEEPADGYAHLSHIPGFIERDGREAEKPDDDTPWPYLRLGIGSADKHCDVVLTEQHARAMHEALGYWLERRASGTTGEPT